MRCMKVVLPEPGLDKVRTLYSCGGRELLLTSHADADYGYWRFCHCDSCGPLALMLRIWIHSVLGEGEMFLYIRMLHT